MNFKLIISAIDPAIFEAMTRHFAKYPKHVQVIPDNFISVIDQVDCIASAANSFGLMDGGSDVWITQKFGEQMAKRVQGKIVLDYWGEQPVGTAFVLRANEAPQAKNKYVAHCPTMRVPADISKTQNVYMAMKAMLIAVAQHNRERVLLSEAGIEDEESLIETVVCPAFGTGVGKVPGEEAAKMMALALYHFMNPPRALSWFFAQQRDGEITHRHLEEDPNQIDLSGFDNLVDLPPVPDVLPPIMDVPDIENMGIDLPPDAPQQ